MSKANGQPLRQALVATLFVILAGCAGSGGERAASDPWEPVNRPIHAVNDAVDRAVLKPVAKGYEWVFPAFVRQGVTNFFANLGTPLTGINNLLQGKGGDAANDLGRFLLNSSFGVAGIFDQATPAGFDQNNEDFGLTLAVWGVPSGPYVVFPFRGPSTLRDALMTPLNAAADPTFYIDERSIRDKLLVLQIVNARQRLFAAEALIQDSPDLYVTLRESYLQNREYQIYDGNPPIDDDFYDDLEDFDDEPND